MSKYTEYTRYPEEELMNSVRIAYPQNDMVLELCDSLEHTLAKLEQNKKDQITEYEAGYIKGMQDYAN